MTKLNSKISDYIANEDALVNLKAEIYANTNSQIPQPVIIIGPEGSGKTTLLQRLYQTYLGKNCIWIDGRSVFTSNDIIVHCSKYKTSIVIVDDLDYYLSRCSYDEQFQLRRYLYSEGAPMLIASASKVHQALVDYNAPFFEGLKKIYLTPISNDLLLSLFENAYERARALFELLSPTIKTLVLIRNVLQINTNANQDTDTLVSLFSYKYINLYTGLPVYSQQIVNALGSCKDDMTLAEIREQNGLPTNILPVYLQSLQKQGIVTADKSIKKNRRYALKDPLFKLWLNYPPR